MEKILILSAFYADANHANSICVQNLAEEFVNMGHEVFVIAKGDNKYEEKIYNGVKIYLYNIDLSSRLFLFFKKGSNLLYKFLFSIFQFIRYCYSFFFYPNVSPIESHRIYKRAQFIIDKYDISLIVGCYRPYENLAVAMKLKNHYGNKIKAITYHLDLLTSPNNSSSLLLSIKENRHKKVIKNELSIIDKMLLPNSAPKLGNSKVQYVDFPLYIPCHGVSVPSYLFETNSINIAYVGSLDEMNRNPSFICKLVDMIPQIEGKHVLLHIWGKLSDTSTREIINKCSYTIYHGMANVDEVPSILRGSDFLLNVGNKVTYRMIPSKIFQLFAANKPIIFSLSSDEDASLHYFEKYGHYIVVKENEADFMNIVDVVSKYIKGNYKKEYPIRENLFVESTPSFICNSILQ